MRCKPLALLCSFFLVIDNDELPVVWEFKQNFSPDIIPFSFGEIFATSKNSTSLEPDLNAYLFPTEFTGFKHGTNY
jgi:hypothetical protein